MFRKDIEKLIRHIEPQIISILVAHGLVKSSKKPQKFGDLKLTQKSKGILGLSDLIITDDWVREWQQKWPPGHRGAFSTTKDKLIRYLLEHDHTLDQINQATDRWLADKQTPYHGSAMHFFYKQEKDAEVSRCEEYIELLNDETPPPDKNYFVE